MEYPYLVLDYCTHAQPQTPPCMGFLTCRALRTPGKVCLRSPAAGGGPAGGGGSGDSGCAEVSAGSLESVDSEALSPSSAA